MNKLTNLNVEYAILMDGSPSCGSNVLLNEEGWPRGGFKRGSGVAAALLKRNNIKVFSSFDERTISIFVKALLSDVEFNRELRDLKDFPKFRHLFTEV